MTAQQKTFAGKINLREQRRFCHKSNRSARVCNRGGFTQKNQEFSKTLNLQLVDLSVRGARIRLQKLGSNIEAISLLCIHIWFLDTQVSLELTLVVTDMIANGTVEARKILLPVNTFFLVPSVGPRVFDSNFT